MPGEGHLATCRAWPGPEGACALVETAWARFLDRRRMERLHEVGRALVSEQNLDRLLDLILVQARRLLDAEAGSLYLVVGEGEDRELLFAHTQNAAVDLPYHRFRMPISPDSMAGFVAATGRSLNIPDVQELGPDAPPAPPVPPARAASSAWSRLMRPCAPSCSCPRHRPRSGKNRNPG